MIVRKFIAESAVTNAGVGPRQVRVIVSDPTTDRDGDVLVPSGCDLTNYRKNPVVLINHDKSQPVGTAVAEIANNRVEALITFAPEGLSELADRYCGLVKAGIINSVSAGFIPKATTPIRGTRGSRVTQWELLEISFVTVPANTAATVIERAAKAGRVLSGANAEKLRQAHAAAEACRSAIADVIDGAGADPVGNDGDEGKHHSGRRRRFEYETRLAEMQGFGRTSRRAEMRRLQMDALR